MSTFTVTVGYTWTNGEVETATKLNATAAPTIAAAQSYTFADGAAATPSLGFNGASTSGFYYASGVGVAIAGSPVGLFTSTGLNACVIGATTPAAASHTTLSATADVTLTGTAGTGGHGYIIGPTVAGKDIAIKLGNTTGTVIFRDSSGNSIGYFDPDIGLAVVLDVESTTVGSGFILASPNGTRYRIAVSNGGVLSAAAA